MIMRVSQEEDIAAARSSCMPDHFSSSFLHATLQSKVMATHRNRRKPLTGTESF
jgi:hypothetical protein